MNNLNEYVTKDPHQMNMHTHILRHTHHKMIQRMLTSCAFVIVAQPRPDRLAPKDNDNYRTKLSKDMI